MSARSRDRRVYLRQLPGAVRPARGHPALAGAAARRHAAGARPGRLPRRATRIPLDRTAAGTDRRRRAPARPAGCCSTSRAPSTGRPAAPSPTASAPPGWPGCVRSGRRCCGRRLAPLAAGEPVDLVPVVAELAGATTAALLGGRRRPGRAGRGGPRGRGGGRPRRSCPARAGPGGPRAARRAVARPGRARSACRRRTPAWRHAGGRRGQHDVSGDPARGGLVRRRPALGRADAPAAGTLVDELLRVTAPTPAAAPGRAPGAGRPSAGCPVRAGDRLLLVARHAAGAHLAGPDRDAPGARRGSPSSSSAPARTPAPAPGWPAPSSPTLLAALAPHRPVVVRARADRRGAARLGAAGGRAGR